VNRWLEWARGEISEPVLSGLALLGIAIAVYVFARWVVVRGLVLLVRRSAFQWDDALTDARVFRRLAHVAPAVVIYLGISAVPKVPDTIDSIIRRLSIVVMIIVVAATLSSFLTAINKIYSRSAVNRRRPIKGYLQLLQIGIVLLSALVVISTLLGRSPWIFVSGIGAMTAVLMLVFKDTILSFVASIQIASNDMVRVGDWIEMPDASADGDVMDIALHTVKVQNWDKTISTIPTYKFISESFKNWRGMSDSGGRRIKRAFYIDMNSIRFLRAEEIDRFSSWALLSEYIEGKRSEIREHNAQPGLNAEINADIRRMTNVGTLRAYIVAYLEAHPKIHQRGYTLMVRQLAPGANGLPIEIYCFSNDQEWVHYEGIQADIFDHILSMVPEFGLEVYQQPSGVDFERIRPDTGQAEKPLGSPPA
jgi:miniconductance mechanosensitive channel